MTQEEITQKATVIAGEFARQLIDLIQDAEEIVPATGKKVCLKATVEMSPSKIAGLKIRLVTNVAMPGAEFTIKETTPPGQEPLPLGGTSGKGEG